MLLTDPHTRVGRPLNEDRIRSVEQERLLAAASK
jgi:hypothetical protein